MRRALSWTTAIAVLLGIGIWGLMRWQQPPEGLQAMPAWPVLKPAQVADIVLRASGPVSSEVKLERQGKDWKVRQGKAWQDADNQAVEDMLHTVAGMRPDRMVTDKPAHYAELRVTDDGDRMTLKNAQGAAMLDLLVGKPGPDLVSTYIRRVGTPQVLSVNRALGWQVRRPASAWLRPKPKAMSGKESKP